MANMSVAFSIRERNSQSGRARGLVALTDTPLARQLPEPVGRPADDQPLTAQEPPLARADACNRVREGSGASMASSFPVHREGRTVSCARGPTDDRHGFVLACWSRSTHGAR